MELSTHGSSGKKVQVDYGSYTVKDEKKTSNSYIKNLNVVVAGDHLYKISGTLSINASDFKLETVCYQKLDKEYNVSFDTLISQEYSVVSAVDSPSYSLKRATCVSTVKFFQDSQNNDAYLLKYSLENSPTVFDSAVSYKLIKAKYNDPEYTKENYSILYLAAKEQGVFINISDKGFGYFHTISTGISELRYFTVKA